VIFYDRKTLGFYLDDADNSRVEITNDYHAELFAKQATGKIIVSDEFGFPITVEPTPPTIEELRETMVLTKLEAKLRLLEYGLYTQINDAILAMDDCFLKVKWLNADFFKRLDIDLDAYLHSLGMTDEQIDDLFTAPNKL
jgi:hypothetical protein